MVDASYREFFVAVAGATGALIGLLFVAVSVSTDRAAAPRTRTDFSLRASAALLLFTNVLAISLAGLVPGVSLGWWAIVAGVAVFAFGAATARLEIALIRRQPGQWRSLGLVFALFALAALELYGGIERLRDPGGIGGLRTLDYLLIAELLVGIARAWELVGQRDTGIIASLVTLARGDADSSAGSQAGSGADLEA